MTLSCRLNTTSCTPTSHLFSYVSIETWELGGSSQREQTALMKPCNSKPVEQVPVLTPPSLSFWLQCVLQRRGKKKTLQVSRLKTLQLISVYIIISLSFSLSHTHRQKHTHLNWFTWWNRRSMASCDFRTFASEWGVVWGCTQNIMTKCDYGQRQRGRSDSHTVCKGTVTPLWRCFKEIFGGDTIFGKWPRCSSVAWQSK